MRDVGEGLEGHVRPLKRCRAVGVTVPRDDVGDTAGCQIQFAEKSDTHAIDHLLELEAGASLDAPSESVAP